MMNDLRITGVYVQYYFVCHRKLWLFSKNIKMEEKSELVAIGKIIDEQSYKREKKHICIDNTINIDFIGTQGSIHEVKKSKSIDNADKFQLKYYLYYLYKRGVKDVAGVLDYPKMKQKVNVTLTEEDIAQIEDVINDIQRILQLDIPPQIKKTKICKKCAYYELCYI